MGVGGVGQCFRERVLNSPLSGESYMQSTNLNLWMQGELLCVLEKYNVNIQLLGNRSQKSLTGQNINLTFTS